MKQQAERRPFSTMCAVEGDHEGCLEAGCGCGCHMNPWPFEAADNPAPEPRWARDTAPV